MLTDSQFSKLYEQYYERSLRFIRPYVRHEMAAEDIASEALIKLWETLRTENIEKPIAFLTTILKNKALDHLRAEEKRADAMSNFAEWKRRELTVRIHTLEACNPETLFTKEVKQLLHQSLHTLPEQTRHCFVESHLHGKAIKDIAQRLGVSIKTVDYHIAKAKKTLRTALREYLPLLFF